MTTVLDSLNLALRKLLETDRRVIIIGEDILDPYGGAFKVTRGLSDKFPERVISTPISEAGIVGIASGMALRGWLPVVEIMFGDFLTLACDQIINHAAKFRWMYNDQVRVPVVIRSPMGGRRGYGPTHSQTLEKHFLGVPGLTVLAPCFIGDPGKLINHAVLNCEDPVLFIENKLLYNMPLEKEPGSGEFQINRINTNNLPVKNNIVDRYALDCPPVFSMTLKDAPTASITIAAYGYMVKYAQQAAIELAYEDEIFCEIIIPTQLAPWNLEPLLTAIDRTQRLIVVEEGTKYLGWGAELAARMCETQDLNPGQIRRVAALEYPIPASEPLESSVLPGKEQIKKAVKSLI